MLNCSISLISMSPGLHDLLYLMTSGTASFKPHPILFFNLLFLGMLNQARLRNRSDGEQNKFYDLFSASFPQSYSFTVQNLSIKIPYLEAFFVHQCCTLLEGLLMLDNQVCFIYFPLSVSPKRVIRRCECEMSLL